MNDRAQKAYTDAVEFLKLTESQAKYLKVVATEIFLLGEVSGLARGQELVEKIYKPKGEDK